MCSSVVHVRSPLSANRIIVDQCATLDTGGNRRLSSMKRYLFAWECGAGLGHLARYQGLIQLLLERGHEVMFASRNLECAQRVYGHLPVRLIQAPLHQRQPEDMVRPKSYLDVLINQGFDHSLGLKARVKAWRHLLEMWQPSAIVADHSPTLLLAQRLDERAACIVGGNGFCIPPMLHPFPPFDGQLAYCREDFIQREQDLLNRVVNPVLRDLGGRTMEHCQQLFSPHPHWLFGLPGLDHYPGRRAETYLGASPSMGGEPASWPDAPGPRVFVYLKPHRVVSQVLTTLRKLQWPTVIFAPDWPEELKQKAQGSNMWLSNKPFDLQSVGKSCQLAVSNGGVNGVTELLLQGIPQLLLPLHIEQLMFSRSAQATGACLVRLLVDSNDLQGLRNALEAVADSAGVLKKAALEFSENQVKSTTVQAGDLLRQLQSSSP